MYADNLIKKIKEVIKPSTIYLFILGLLVYSPFMVSQLNNADDNTFGYLYHGAGYGTEDNLGRFFIKFFDIWRNRIVSPVLIIALCIVFLCVTAQLVNEILDIKSIVIQFFVGAFILFSPSVADLFTYYYTADSYCFAYMLMAFSMYILLKSDFKLKWLWSGLLIVTSLGIYQAYIGFAIFLISAYFLKKALDNSGSRELIFDYLCVAGSMVVYYIIFKLLAIVGYLHPLEDRGMGGMFETIFSLLPQKIVEMYRAVYEYYFTDVIISNAWFGRKYLNGLTIILIVVLLIYSIYSKKIHKNISQILMVIFTVFAAISSMTMIVVLGPDTSIYAETGILMLPLMNGIYIILMMLGDINVGSKKSREIMILVSEGCALLLTIIMIVFIQVFARYIDQQQKQLTSLATRVAGRIEELPEYEEGQKVLAVGRPHRGNYSLPDEQYESITKGMISHYSMIFGADDQISSGWVKAFKYYVGIEYSECDAEERDALLNSEEVKNMGIYPAEDSVKRIGDVTVVKFSE